MEGPANMPVTVLTGFLGSGKTTLLAALLRSPQLARTAVIINEFGEVGLDHDLVAASDESFVTLQTGCLCCKIRGDLAATLHDLLARRADGTVQPFERVVIETSGLADPAPILQALMTDDALAERLTLAGVVTTVDAVAGLATLDRQFESVKQAAVADRIIVTKTDMAEPSPALLRRLAALNPLAPLLTAVNGDLAPDVVLGGGIYDLDAKSDEVRSWLSDGRGTEHGRAHDHGGGHDPNRHGPDIACFAIVREAPMPAVALTLLLEILAEHCGPDLLRMKGILAIAESPGRPAVVHGVQHVFHAPVWLDAWPSDDRRSRLVFIVRNIPRAWIVSVIAAVEAEVADVAVAR